MLYFIKTKMENNLENVLDKPRCILGLDVSTSTIGMSLAMYDGKETKIIDVTHLKLKISKSFKGIEALFEKNKLFIEKIKEYQQYPIDTVVIEEPLTSSNNIFTVETLIRFNTLVSYHIYKELNLIPYYISSYDARKYGMPQLMAVRKYNKKGEIYPITKIRHALKHNELVLFGGYDWNVEKKDVIWNYISNLYPNIKWVYNKKGELSNENFDASDSLICILGFINKVKYQSNEPQIVSLDENEFENGIIFKYVINFCGQQIENKIEINK